MKILLILASTVLIIAGCSARGSNWYQDNIDGAVGSHPALASTLVDVAPLALQAFPLDLPPDAANLETRLAPAGQFTSHGLIDYDTYTIPVLSGRRTYEGYPIYAFTCDGDSGLCSDPQGHTLGTPGEVAVQLTQVRNRDVLTRGFRCATICLDQHNHIVGSVSPAMTQWLINHPQH